MTSVAQISSTEEIGTENVCEIRLECHPTQPNQQLIFMIERVPIGFFEIKSNMNFFESHSSSKVEYSKMFVYLKLHEYINFVH